MSALALILVTHDSAHWLRPFFDSWDETLGRTPALRAAGIEEFIADSGSIDVEAALAAGVRPEARQIKCGHVGFGAAANMAARETQAPWLLLCNPDLTFSTDFASAFLEPLLTDGSKPWSQAACLAPRLLNPDGSVQASVGRFPTVLALLRDQFRSRARRKYDLPQPTDTCSVDWVAGACLLIRRDAFLSVGGFDEKFFLYVEDVDLQRRLKGEAPGTRDAACSATWFIPKATVTHHLPNAARDRRPDIQRYAARGLLRYFAKHSARSLLAYRFLALVSCRLSVAEVLAPRSTILERPTGP